MIWINKWIRNPKNEPRGPFLESPGKFFAPESRSKISNLTITKLFYSKILNMNRGSVEVLFIQGVSGVITSWFSGTDYLKVALPTQKVSRAFEKRGPWNDWLIDWFCSTLWSTENSLDLSLTSSGGEENDEDVTFSEPPLDDEDDEPLTRPSSGFSPSPLPLTSTQKPMGQKLNDNQGDKK